MQVEEKSEQKRTNDLSAKLAVFSLGEPKAVYCFSDFKRALQKILLLMPESHISVLEKKTDFCIERARMAAKRMPSRRANGILARSFNVKRQNLKRYCKLCDYIENEKQT